MVDQIEAAEAEVLARTSDKEVSEAGNVYAKVFRIKANGLDDAESELHAANKAATLEFAIQQGLHPKGEVTVLSTDLLETNRRGEQTWDVVYGVEVVPAGGDADAAGTVTPSSYIAAIGGSTAEGDDPTGPLSPGDQAEQAVADAERSDEAPATARKSGKA